MSTYEKLATFTAIYAAILSTGLFIKEIIENKKKLSIFVEFIAYYDTVRLLIINNSKRPITIESISMKIDRESVPQNALFDPHQSDIEFPIKINSFDSQQFIFDAAVTTSITDDLHDLSLLLKKNRITVTDIDGNNYSKYSFRVINPKF